MIDTDKYEGHTPGPWVVNNPDDYETSLIFSVGALKFVSSANTQLIADAPLLLDFIVWVKNTHPHYYHKLTEAYQSAKNNR